MSFIYHFGAGKAEGSAADKALLGGRRRPCEWVDWDFSTTGFTVTTEACQHFFKYGGQWPENLESDIAKAVSQLNSSPKRIWFRAKSIAGLSSLRCTCLNARDDGHHSQSWIE